MARDVAGKGQVLPIRDELQLDSTQTIRIAAAADAHVTLWVSIAEYALELQQR